MRRPKHSTLTTRSDSPCVLGQQIWLMGLRRMTLVSRRYPVSPGLSVRVRTGHVVCGCNLEIVSASNISQPWQWNGLTSLIHKSAVQITVL
jgi:hypothetical protein